MILTVLPVQAKIAPPPSEVVFDVHLVNQDEVMVRV